MDFKKIFALCFLALNLGLVGCTATVVDSGESDYLIGNRTAGTSALSSPDEGDSQSLIIFDKTVRRIHQFSLDDMKHTRALGVLSPEFDHYVLFGQSGNYIVDLSKKGLSIFNKYNQANHQPIKFQGDPVSAALLSSKGLLVVYDDLMSVGMLKLDANGEVLKSWVGGAAVSGSSSIAAGDLNVDGKLILAMSDGSIVLVDPEQSMTQKAWVKEPAFNSGLSGIKWLAPLSYNANLVMIRTNTKLALLDLNSKMIVSSYDIVDTLVKVSKFTDPHIVLSNESAVKVVYAEGTLIKEKVFYLHTKKFEMNYLMNSNLDLSRDTWSFVDTKSKVQYFYNDLDVSKKSRRFVRYRFSDTLAANNLDVADDTQVEIGSNFIFALYPSELGRATRYDIDTEAKSEVKLFNLKYIPAN